MGPRMLELARDLTAGARTPTTRPSPEHTPQGEGNPRPRGVPRSRAISHLLDEDSARARATARSRVSKTLRHPAYVRNLLRLGFSEADFAAGGSDRLIDSLVAWGDQAAVAKRLRAHIEAGADHVAVQVIAADDRILPWQEWRLLAGAVSMVRN